MSALRNATDDIDFAIANTEFLYSSDLNTIYHNVVQVEKIEDKWTKQHRLKFKYFWDC